MGIGDWGLEIGKRWSHFPRMLYTKKLNAINFFTDFEFIHKCRGINILNTLISLVLNKYKNYENLILLKWKNYKNQKI